MQRYFSILILFFASCSDNPLGEKKMVSSDSQKQIDTSTAVIKIDSTQLSVDTSTLKRIQYTNDEYILFLKNGLSDWVNYYKTKYPDFDVSKFTRSNVYVPFENLEFGKFHSPKSKEDFLEYSLLNRWSGDQKYFVDIYSIRYSIEKVNGKYLLEGNDPESGITLTKLSDSTICRIAYTGSEDSFEDVNWIDDTRFVVTGSSFTSSQDSIQPFFGIFDIIKKQILYFKYKNLPVKNGPSYFSKKFDNYWPAESNPKK
jgi:hypothetical protein